MDAWSCSLVQVSFGLISGGTERVRNTVRGGKPRLPRTPLASYPHQPPIGARAMPASHDRMTTAVRSASGPPPVSHGRTTSHCSTGDRAKPASHSLRHQLGRPVVGRIAGPYRYCHAVGRTRAGHVHAGRIADGVNSRGAALCAPRPAPCGVSWASTRCRIASGARPRRHGDTGPSAATPHAP